MIFDERVHEELDKIATLLITKRKQYKTMDTAILSKSTEIDKITCRLDDKLKSMQTQGFNDEDLTDLLGYLILLKIAVGDV